MSKLNGLPLLMATITEPLTGRWVAYAEVDTQDDIAGAVAFDIEGIAFSGSVHLGGVESGRWCGQLVGGTGGLSLTLDARAYRGCPLSVPLAELLTDTAETLAGTSDTLVSAFVPQWHRTASPAIHTLARLATSAGLTWRVLRDGTIWLGTDAWAEASDPGVEVHALRHLRMVELAPLSPVVLPGTSFGGDHVETVITRLDTGSIRQECYLASVS